MSITILSDVILPTWVAAAGMRGRQIRRNTRTQAQNGTMQVNVEWARTLRQYELGTVPLTVAQWQAIEGLHEVTEGGAFGFLMRDPKDHAALIADGVAALAGEASYQLHKRYTSAGSTRTKDRIITRPRAAGFAVKVAGVALPAEDYTLDADTGLLSIPDAPAAEAISWSGEFLVPVHFLSDQIDWETVAIGPAEARLMAGPSVVLMEVLE